MAAHIDYTFFTVSRSAARSASQDTSDPAYFRQNSSNQTGQQLHQQQVSSMSQHKFAAVIAACTPASSLAGSI